MVSFALLLSPRPHHGKSLQSPEPLDDQLPITADLRAAALYVFLRAHVFEPLPLTAVAEGNLRK
jgi:hypothetical protein